MHPLAALLGYCQLHSNGSIVNMLWVAQSVAIIFWVESVKEIHFFNHQMSTIH